MSDQPISHRDAGREEARYAWDQRRIVLDERGASSPIQTGFGNWGEHRYSSQPERGLGSKQVQAIRENMHVMGRQIN